MCCESWILSGKNTSTFSSQTLCFVELLILPDSEDLYAEATQNIVERYGKTFDWSTRIEVMGQTGVDRSKKLVELLDLPISWEEYYDLAIEQHKILMQGAYLKPGMFFAFQIRKVRIKKFLNR